MNGQLTDMKIDLISSPLTPKLLREAAAQLRSHAWLKGSFFSFKEGEDLDGDSVQQEATAVERMLLGEEPCGLCATGAVLYAAKLTGIFPQHDSHPIWNYEGKVESLLAPIRKLSQKILGDHTIVFHNDMVANRKEEVALVLEQIADYVEKSPKEVNELLSPFGYYLPLEQENENV